MLQRMMGRMQGWMLGVIQRHGFLGILLLASWPNAAFDLCGICCGHFQMPFWQFFGATFLGKALVKVCGSMSRSGPASEAALAQKYTYADMMPYASVCRDLVKEAMLLTS